MAIDPKELRISNYVKCKVSNDAAIYQVMAIDGINLKVMLSGARYGEWYDIGKIKPIPITEEELLRLGFKCIHANNKHYIISDPNGFNGSYNFSILPTIDNQWYIAFSDELNGYKDYIPTTKIKHVHHLQNLYFDLTGEELVYEHNAIKNNEIGELSQ